MGRLLVQHLFQQIINNITIIAGESSDKIVAFLVVERGGLHRQRRQFQAGNPAFGAGFQRRHIRRRQIEAHDLINENGRFRFSKPQINISYLCHLAAHPPAGQGEWRVGAAGDDQMQARGHMGQQENNPVMDRWLMDGVIILQNQDALLIFRAAGGNFVDQGRYGRCRRITQRSQNRLPKIRQDRLQRGHHIRPELHRIIVAFI